MSNEEFLAANKHTRKLYVFFCLFFAAMVAIEMGAFRWFWVALMASSLLRLAVVAALLDKADKLQRIPDCPNIPPPPPRSARPNPAS